MTSIFRRFVLDLARARGRCLPAALACSIALSVVPNVAFALATAQIQLPSQSDKPKGNVVPHHECTVCGTRNYNVPSTAKLDEQGLPIAFCATCKKEVAFRPSEAGEPKKPARGAQGTGRLRLPPTDGNPPDAPAQTGPVAAAKEGEPANANPAAPKTADGAKDGGPTAFVFAEVAKARELADPLVGQAVDSLCGMGDAGREAARRELSAESPTRLFVAARVLLRCGASNDIDLVLNRLRDRLPPTTCAPLLEELSRADPVRASPRFFVALLDHPTATMRSAAERALRKQIGPELVPLLAEKLESKRGETRLAAVGLLADVDDPSVVELFFAHLADPKPSVALATGRALAARPGAAIDARLLSIAFRQRWILRDSSYALLCILDREDRALAPILDETHVDPLLDGLKSNDPFVGGTCAAALAGIGFRSQRTHQTGWLDQEVVDRLVLAVSGKVFHDDFSALAGPALARLRLISGQDFGADGPRWIEWWVAARGHFFARRAWIEAGPGDETSLVVRWDGAGESFVLLGASAAVSSRTSGIASVAGTRGAASAREVASCFLTEGEARELLAAFQREGVLGPEKLPGLRGTRSDSERTLEITIAGRGKTFVFGADAPEPWFERCAAAAQATRERNRWQRFAPPGTSQLAFWQEQSPWWAGEHTDAERALRLKSIVLGALDVASGVAPGLAPSLSAGVSRDADEDAAVAELERLYATPAFAETADFERLLGVLRAEVGYGDRAHALARLALRAGRAGSDQPLDAERARRLVITLVERFGPPARDDIAAVLLHSDVSVARSLAGDTRLTLRAAAVPALARSTDESDRAKLIKLIEDHEPEVEIAAVRALGELHVESARTELIVRARMAAPPVRAAALDAISRLGGEFVLDALLFGASASEPEVRAAAARGLAEMADPASASLLIAMLGEGSTSAVFAPARAGLARLGERAWPELLRAVHKNNHPARRDAALILAEAGSPEPVTALMQILSTHPDDSHVASELAILTGVDYRGQPDPASAWWTWYDGVVHDDALAWFRAALERAGESTPPAESLRGAGTREGCLFLVSVLSRNEAHLVERARRELGRLLQRELGDLPARGPQRTTWISDLRESILASRDQ